MKKFKILSLVMAVIICLSSLTVFAAALDFGDVNGDNKTTAADARTVLRAAVGLEVLNAEQTKASDVNFDGKITAADARSILRAAVGLETLHATHSYTANVTKAATCTEEGVKTYSCVCGESYTEAIPATGHSFNMKVTSAATCTTCGNATIPAFNTIVNVLKDTSAESGGVKYQTGVLEDIVHNDKMVFGGKFADMLEDETNVAVTEVTYTPGGTNRLISKTNFPTNSASFVSDLAEKDVKSIKVEKVNNTKLFSALPDKYTYNKTEYDITNLKAIAFDEAYKITVVIPVEKIDIKKAATGASVYDKIYIANYNNKLESLRAEINGNLNSLSSELDGAGLKLSSSGSIASSLTVEYYVDTVNYAPLGAKYSHNFDIVFDIKVKGPTGLIEYITMYQSMYMASNSYYLFGKIN